MKIVCIDNSGYGEGRITIGKKYHVLETIEHASPYFNSEGRATRYKIINDKNSKITYSSTRFKTLQDMREIKIKTILC